MLRQTEKNVRRTVTVHRVHVLLNAVGPKESLLDALRVILKVIVIHVIPDITGKVGNVLHAAVVKPVLRDRHQLRIVHRHRHHHHRRPNQLEIYVHQTVNVHREHAILNVVVPKDNLLDAPIVILMVIVKHVLQDIT